MTNLNEVRNGDTVRVTIEGTVCQRTRGGLPYGSDTRTIRLIVGEEGKSDAQISWDEETVEPLIEIIGTEFESGDIAEINPNGYTTWRRAIFIVTSEDKRYWMDGSGSMWTNVKHSNIRNIDRVTPIPEV